MSDPKATDATTFGPPFEPTAAELSKVTRPRDPNSREGRVQHCMDIMRDLRWDRGKTGQKLLAEWGVSQGTIDAVASEAWRRVKAEVVDPSLVGPDICLNIQKVMRDALAETDDPAWLDGGAGKDGQRRVYQESPNVARKVVLEAAKVYAAIVVTGPPTRLELTGKDGVALNSPADAARLVREAFTQAAARTSPNARVLAEAFGGDPNGGVPSSQHAASDDDDTDPAA